MTKLSWFERKFIFGLPAGMLPFYLDRLSGTAIRFHEKIKGYSDEALSFRQDGKWSIKENIAHLAEVGQISDRRVDEIKKGVPVLSPAVFALTQDYNSKSISWVLEYFEKCRRKTLLEYAGIRSEDFEKSSIHPRLKVPLTVVDLAWFDAEHDDHHSVRISEILETMKAR